MLNEQWKIRSVASLLFTGIDISSSNDVIMFSASEKSLFLRAVFSYMQWSCLSYLGISFTPFKQKKIVVIYRMITKLVVSITSNCVRKSVKKHSVLKQNGILL